MQMWRRTSPLFWQSNHLINKSINFFKKKKGAPPFGQMKRRRRQKNGASTVELLIYSEEEMGQPERFSLEALAVGVLFFSGGKLSRADRYIRVSCDMI